MFLLNIISLSNLHIQYNTDYNIVIRLIHKLYIIEILELHTINVLHIYIIIIILYVY